MRDFYHFMARIVEQGIALSPAFDGARFDAAGPDRKPTIGDGEQKCTDREASRSRSMSALPDRLHGPGKGQFRGLASVSCCSHDHEAPQEVVGQQNQCQFAHHHLWRAGAQLSESHRRLDVAKAKLHVPAPTVELRKRLGIVALLVQQRGHDRNIQSSARRGCLYEP